MPAGGRMKTWIFVPGTIPVVEMLRQSRSPSVAMCPIASVFGASAGAVAGSPSGSRFWVTVTGA